MDDTEMFNGDDLSMVPEIVVDLMTKLEDTNVIPLTAEMESDTDVLLPPAMVALEVDVAVEEISKLLQEIPSAQPLVPSSGCPKLRDPDGAAGTTVPADLTEASLPGRPFYLVPGQSWTMAPHATEGRFIGGEAAASHPLIIHPRLQDDEGASKGPLTGCIATALNG